jgi:L-lactate dehydrogenase
VSGTGPIRIAIVGVGNVGASLAYALVLGGLAAEIVLIDNNRARAEGEAMDLSHAVPFAEPTHVWAGDYDDCAGAAVTVICAGANQKPGETRLDLLRRNADILRAIVPQVVRYNPEGILLVATNPVDVLTFGALKLSGLPASAVFGSGTTLDTARFKYLLGEHYGVDPRSVHAYIIGEHGDSEVPVWSLANIAGMQLMKYCEAQAIGCTPEDMDSIFRKTRDAAYEVIQRKGATYYGVAAGLLRIIEAIVRDQRTVLTVSTLVEDLHGLSGVCLSLPCVIGQDGVERVIRLDLSQKESEALRQSAAVLEAAIAQVSFT